MSTDTAVNADGPVLVDRRTLLDPELQAQFARVGYLRLPLLDDEAVERLRAIYDEVFPEPMTGFIPTYAVSTPERKARATAMVKEVLLPVIDPLFDHHRAFNSSFLMKWPGDDSALPLHQDTCYVDERVFRSAVVWVALDDADEDLDNGPLQVVTASHRFDRMPRGTRTWWPYGGVTDFVEEHCLESLPVRKGDVLIMDNALIHCSFPNRSGEPRLAVALSMAPEEAGLIHAVGRDDGTVSIHDVDESFFVEESPYGLQAKEFPSRYPRREVGPVAMVTVTEADIADLCGLPDGTVTEATTTEATTTAAAEEPLPVDVPAPVVDPVAEVEPVVAVDPVVADEGNGPGQVAVAVETLMRVNNRLIGHAEHLRPVLDPAAFEWTGVLERQWRDIRREAEAVLVTRRVPRIEEILGASQGNEGDWNTFIILAHRRPVGFNASLCPVTTEALTAVPGIQSALFSVFAPGTHLPSHQAPNRGVLRYHLGLIVPDPPDSCRLRVVDETLSYREGESILFDDTFEHEAWNDADQPRVTLLLEVVRPLRTPYRQMNALTQRAFGFYPEARGAMARLERLEWILNGSP